MAGVAADRKPLLDKLAAYQPADPYEARMAKDLIQFVEAHEDCFERSLAIGHVTGMLLLALLLLAGLAVAVRNAYGMLAVLAALVAVAAVCLYGSALVQEGFGYVATWFLLLGGVRPVIELARERRRGGRGSDADHLARLTPVPGGAWVVIFGLVALAALAVSARWLVR